MSLSEMADKASSGELACLALSHAAVLVVDVLKEAVKATLSFLPLDMAVQTQPFRSALCTMSDTKTSHQYGPQCLLSLSSFSYYCT